MDTTPIFPEEIIIQILTHLPAKTLHRFKCVSKPWLSLINSPYFLKAYLTLSPPHPPSWIFLHRYGHFPSHRDPLQSRNISISFSLAQPPSVSYLTLSGTPRDEPPFILTSSKGLILFATSAHSLFIANPVTNDFYPLLQPQMTLNKSMAYVALAAKFSPSLDDVSLVIMELRAPTNPSKEAATMLIYSSEKAEWETRSVRYKAGSRRKGWVSQLEAGAVSDTFEVGGRVFWGMVSAGLAVLDDPFGERLELRFIPLPEGHEVPYNTPGLKEERLLYPVGEFMMYTRSEVDGRSSVWRLSDVEKGKWSLLFFAAGELPSGLPAGPGEFVLCGFHPLEDEMAVFVAHDKSVLVNYKENKVVVIGRYPRHADDDMHMAIFPLALPNWPTPIPKRFTATALKDKGNIDFQLKNFGDAILYYSRSISCLPTAAAYANRAAANLQLGNFLEAEMDCSEALKIDQQYSKAYARRATVRKELGKLLEAKEDVEMALKQGGGGGGLHQELVKLYAEILCALEKEIVNREEDGGL